MFRKAYLCLRYVGVLRKVGAERNLLIALCFDSNSREGQQKIELMFQSYRSYNRMVNLIQISEHILKKKKYADETKSLNKKIGETNL